MNGVIRCEPPPPHRFRPNASFDRCDGLFVRAPKRGAALGGARATCSPYTSPPPPPSPLHHFPCPRRQAPAVPVHRNASPRPPARATHANNSQHNTTSDTHKQNASQHTKRPR
ncbi:unnamed protein product, partial [Iphiclides podalirius]